MRAIHLRNSRTPRIRDLTFGLFIALLLSGSMLLGSSVAPSRFDLGSFQSDPMSHIYNVWQPEAYLHVVSLRNADTGCNEWVIYDPLLLLHMQGSVRAECVKQLAMDHSARVLYHRNTTYPRATTKEFVAALTHEAYTVINLEGRAVYCQSNILSYLSSDAIAAASGESTSEGSQFIPDLGLLSTIAWFSFQQQHDIKEVDVSSLTPPSFGTPSSPRSTGTLWTVDLSTPATDASRFSTPVVPDRAFVSGDFCNGVHIVAHDLLDPISLQVKEYYQAQYRVWSAGAVRAGSCTDFIAGRETTDAFVSVSADGSAIAVLNPAHRSASASPVRPPASSPLLVPKTPAMPPPITPAIGQTPAGSPYVGLPSASSGSTIQIPAPPAIPAVVSSSSSPALRTPAISAPVSPGSSAGLPPVSSVRTPVPPATPTVSTGARSAGSSSVPPSPVPPTPAAPYPVTPVASVAPSSAPVTPAPLPKVHTSLVPGAPLPLGGMMGWGGPGQPVPSDPTFGGETAGGMAGTPMPPARISPLPFIPCNIVKLPSEGALAPPETTNDFTISRRPRSGGYASLREMMDAHPEVEWKTLECLHASGHGITTITEAEMRCMPKLKVLNLSWNCISTIEKGAFCGDQLRYVDLSNNELTQFPCCVHAPLLETLNLSNDTCGVGNTIKDLPLSSFVRTEGGETLISHIRQIVLSGAVCRASTIISPAVWRVSLGFLVDTHLEGYAYYAWQGRDTDFARLCIDTDTLPDNFSVHRGNFMDVFAAMPGCSKTPARREAVDLIRSRELAPLDWSPVSIFLGKEGCGACCVVRDTMKTTLHSLTCECVMSS